MEFKPRKKHLRADHLSLLSTELEVEDIDNEFPDDELFVVWSILIWYEHLAMFLSFQKYPEGLDKNERRKICINSTHFALVAGRLYQRGIDGIL